MTILSSPTLPSRWPRSAACVLALVLAPACSGKAPSQPTEAELHSGDGRSVGPVTDTHDFACADGSHLRVAFGRDAPTISIRARPTAPALVLTAQADGHPYENGGNRAVIVDRYLRIDLADGSHRTCRRQTRG